MNAGIGLRLEETTVNAFKNAAQDFLPRYVYTDMMLPKESSYTASFWFDMIEWTIEWHDITYSLPKFDLTDIVFDFKNDYGIPKIICNFPVLEDWKINAIQDTNSIWLPEKAPVELGFENFDINFVATLLVTDEGNIKPHFWEIHIKFGDSYFTHSNWFFAFTFHQFVKFGFLVIENTAFICGELILSEMGEPLVTKVFNNFRIGYPQIPTPFLG